MLTINIWEILVKTARFIPYAKFLYQVICLGTETLQSCQNLDHCPIRNKFFIYQKFHVIHVPVKLLIPIYQQFTYTLANDFISRPLVIHDI